MNLPKLRESVIKVKAKRAQYDRPKRLLHKSGLVYRLGEIVWNRKRSTMESVSYSSEQCICVKYALYLWHVGLF